MTGKREKITNEIGKGSGKEIDKEIDNIETIGSPLNHQIKKQGKGSQGIKTIPTSRKDRGNTLNTKNNQNNQNDKSGKNGKSNENNVDVPSVMPVEGLAEEPRRRLKLGLISSDFGVHPVATLIRGLVQFIDREYVELYCFAVNDAVSRGELWRALYDDIPL